MIKTNTCSQIISGKKIATIKAKNAPTANQMLDKSMVNASITPVKIIIPNQIKKKRLGKIQ